MPIITISRQYGSGGSVIAAHTPRFQAAEQSLFVGAAVLAECARVASAALARGE